VRQKKTSATQTSEMTTGNDVDFGVVDCDVDCDDVSDVTECDADEGDEAEMETALISLPSWLRTHTRQVVGQNFDL